MTRKFNIILLEDDAFSDEMKRYLENKLEGLVEIHQAWNIDDARALDRAMKVDLVVADVMQNGQPQGLEFVLEVAHRVPGIIYSASSPEEFGIVVKRSPTVVFLPKDDDILESLVTNIRQSLARLEHLTEIAPRYPMNNLRGTVLSIRVPLIEADVNAAAPTDLILGWDFGLFPVVNQVLANIASSHQGHVISIAGQTTRVFFQESDASDSFQRARETFGGVKQSLRSMLPHTLAPHPIAGGIVKGACIRTILCDSASPGILAMVGRVVDVADQIALKSDLGELGCAPILLDTRDNESLKKYKGLSREDTVRLVGFAEPLKLVFLQE